MRPFSFGARVRKGGERMFEPTEGEKEAVHERERGNDES